MQHSATKNHLVKDFTESELIAACVNKNPAAQRVIYEQYFSKMVALCHRYVNSREVAKDMVQDGFVIVFDKIGMYAGTGSFEGWLRRIFVNVSLTYLRKNDALRYSDPLEASVSKAGFSESTLDQIATKDIYKCIEQMPDGFRTVFNLYAIEGYPHQEIAQMLHISESTSRSQFLRARMWLQNKLNNQLK